MSETNTKLQIDTEYPNITPDKIRKYLPDSNHCKNQRSTKSNKISTIRRKK